MTDKGRGIVVNTSPWIALSICGQIPLLEKLYTDVLHIVLEKRSWQEGNKVLVSTN